MFVSKKERVEHWYENECDECTDKKPAHDGYGQGAEHGVGYKWNHTENGGQRCHHPLLRNGQAADGELPALHGAAAGAQRGDGGGVSAGR